jgi:hypothetical protein
MIIFNKYPHVMELLEYYADALKNDEIINILKRCVNSEHDAEHLSRFIWKMTDEMSEDSNEGKIILGREDNREMLPDVEYEVTLYLDNKGYRNIWNRISDEKNV